MLTKFLIKTKTCIGEKIVYPTNIDGKTWYSPSEELNYIHIFYSVQKSIQNGTETLILNPEMP